MTTILTVRRNNNVVLGGDGQATFNNIVLKHTAKKIKKIYNDNIIVGFAGNTIDAISLFKKLEIKLEMYQGNLILASTALVKDWYYNSVIPKLEAMLLVVDKTSTLLISGNGDIVTPENDIIAIGSGSNFAQASAIALLENTKLNAYDIVLKSLEIAANYCIYTNHNFIIKEINY